MSAGEAVSLLASPCDKQLHIYSIFFLWPNDHIWPSILNRHYGKA